MEPKKEILILDSDSDSYSSIEKTLSLQRGVSQNYSCTLSNEDILDQTIHTNQQSTNSLNILFFKRKGQQLVSTLCLRTIINKFKEFCSSNMISLNLLMNEKTLKQYALCDPQKSKGVFVKFSKQKRLCCQINIYNLSKIYNFLRSMQDKAYNVKSSKQLLKQEYVKKVLFSEISQLNNVNQTFDATAFFKNVDQDMLKQQLETQICKSQYNVEIDSPEICNVKKKSPKNKKLLKKARIKGCKSIQQKQVKKQKVQIILQNEQKNINKISKQNRIYIKSEPVIIQIKQDSKTDKIQNWIKEVLSNNQLIQEVLTIIPSLKTDQNLFLDLPQVDKLQSFKEKPYILNKILQKISLLKKQISSEEIVKILANLIENRENLKQTPSEISLKVFVMLLSIDDEIQAVKV